MFAEATAHSFNPGLQSRNWNSQKPTLYFGYTHASRACRREPQFPQYVGRYLDPGFEGPHIHATG